jgi:hypothetical protein
VTDNPDGGIPHHPVAVAGRSGWAWASTWTQESVPMKMVASWLFSGDVLYVVSIKASEERWVTVGPVFDSILSTFRVPD